ncbi:MAG: putative phosphoglycerate mutase [Glaciecola sp.]|jgi:probable phosphoglycerate mutase
MWIYLIRHAETDGNLQRIVQMPNTPLSTRGHQQAQCLANAYSQVPISNIVSSDYARTQSTASALQKQVNCPMSLNELLRERHFGDLRGKAYDDIDHDFFALNYHPPGGESYSQFVDRIGKAWQQLTELANQQKGDTVVVSHGLVLRCILTEILMLPSQLLAQTDIQNTSVTKVNLDDYTDIPMLCDVGHLNDMT